jgi:hypothetical protein
VPPRSVIVAIAAIVIARCTIPGHNISRCRHYINPRRINPGGIIVGRVWVIAIGIAIDVIGIWIAAIVCCIWIWGIGWVIII